MKKIIILAVVLIVGAIGTLKLFQTFVVPKQFTRIATERVGTDATTAMADGLYVFIGGAGAPLPDPLRSGPTLGILAGDQAFLIDSGSGGLRNLSMMGFPVGRLDHIYLTHLHSDHIDGLGEALMLAWVSGSRDTPLPVTGPEGTTIVTDGFRQAYQQDAGYRTAHHGPNVANPAGFGALATDITTQGGTVLVETDTLKITAFAVDHAPVKGALGYRIDYKDRSISVSGDTVFSGNLIAQSRGVDVLFHEALNPDMVGVLQTAAKDNGATNLAKIMSDIVDYHTSPKEAAQAASDAGAAALVLYHIVPPLPTKALDRMFLGDAATVYDGKITVSRDGVMVGLPSGSDAVIYENRL
jgi:ribonuclease Z